MGPNLHNIHLFAYCAFLSIMSMPVTVEIQAKQVKTFIRFAVSYLSCLL